MRATLRSMRPWGNLPVSLWRPKTPSRRETSPDSQSSWKRLGETSVDHLMHEFVISTFQNFCLRRSLYGDECIGRKNLRMVEIGQRFDAACKFPGLTFELQLDFPLSIMGDIRNCSLVRLRWCNCWPFEGPDPFRGAKKSLRGGRLRHHQSIAQLACVSASAMYRWTRGISDLLSFGIGYKICV